MSAAITLATARRILLQLRHDPRTVGMLLLIPTLLMVLLRYVLNAASLFDHAAPTLLAIFPFTLMFIITSITVLRERTTTTLERLMTMPLAKIDLLLGYAIAFGAVTVLQVGLASLVSLTLLGLTVTGSIPLLLLIALLDAWLGMALGLFVSAFARSEFQAVQFFPLIALPQVLLCGLFIPRGQMAGALQVLAYLMPLSYAVEALDHVTVSASITGTLIRDLLVVAGCIGVALGLGAATLRRRTP
ncbi:MAG TPA: ABC transporter permease [Chloroflexota bacterium]|nr:ABC transporter permease [Chloroflexota bacterium]